MTLGAPRTGLGALGLHGGAEFRGDDRFLGALLRASLASRRSGPGSRPLRVILLPTAAAHHRPGLAAAAGIAAFEQVALAVGVRIAPGEARVVDERSAADEELVARLETADLVYLPGGDPGIVLDVLAGSAALAAVTRARLRGAVVAGASAGAMALGQWTWTPDGMRRGFGWAGPIVVIPHASPDRVAEAASERERLAGPARGDLGVLLLDERTGVVGDGHRWTVSGAGSAHWLAPHSSVPATLPDGGLFGA